MNVTVDEGVAIEPSARTEFVWFIVFPLTVAVDPKTFICRLLVYVSLASIVSELLYNSVFAHVDGFPVISIVFALIVVVLLALTNPLLKPPFSVNFSLAVIRLVDSVNSNVPYLLPPSKVIFFASNTLLFFFSSIPLPPTWLSSPRECPDFCVDVLFSPYYI